MQHSPNLSTLLFQTYHPTAQMSLIMRFRESYNSMTMSRESRSLKKPNCDCLKLAKQWYSVWVKLCYFWTTAFSQEVQKH